MIEITDMQQWIATISHLINIRKYVPKLFRRRDLKPKEQLGVTRITPVIYCGGVGVSGEYAASNNPNEPMRYKIRVDLPPGARILNAWYSPLHNLSGMLAFALIDVEPYDNTDICLKVAAFPTSNARMRIAVNVLYAKG
jgi:hypothetical protein